MQVTYRFLKNKKREYIVDILSTGEVITTKKQADATFWRPSSISSMNNYMKFIRKHKTVLTELGFKMMEDDFWIWETPKNVK